MANSVVAGVYDTVVDRESAYERLKGRAERKRRARGNHAASAGAVAALVLRTCRRWNRWAWAERAVDGVAIPGNGDGEERGPHYRQHRGTPDRSRRLGSLLGGSRTFGA